MGPVPGGKIIPKLHPPLLLFASLFKFNSRRNSRVPSRLPCCPFFLQILLHKTHSPNTKHRRPNIRQSPSNPKSHSFFLQRHNQNRRDHRNHQKPNPPKPSKPQQHTPKQRTRFISLHHRFAICQFPSYFNWPGILQYRQQRWSPQRSFRRRRHTERQTVPLLRKESGNEEQRPHIIANRSTRHSAESHDWSFRERANQEQSLEDRGTNGKVDVSEL